MTVVPHVTSEPGGAAWIGEVLAGHLGAETVAEVARNPLDHGVGDLLEECLPDGWSEPLVLLRTKYKPSRKLTAYYRLSSGPNDPEPRHLAVSWCVQPAATDGPRHALTATSANGLLQVSLSPADPSMPQLARLTDQEHLVGVLAELTGGPDGPVTRVRVRTVRYRPGQRHVLDVGRGLSAEDVYVKTDRDDSGARAVPVARGVAPVLAERCPGVGVVEPLGYLGSDRAAFWRRVPGGPLGRRLAVDPATGVTLLRLVGRALRTLHDAVDPALAGVSTRDVASEATTTLRAGEHVTALLPATGRTYAGLVCEIVGTLDRLPAEPLAFAYGDAKCDNLMVHRDEVRILDLDRACAAEPALDLAKLLADLRWWCPDRADVLEGALRDGYGPCDPLRWTRAELMAALYEVYFAARRCAVHDPMWPTRVRTQVARAAGRIRETV